MSGSRRRRRPRQVPSSQASGTSWGGRSVGSSTARSAVRGVAVARTSRWTIRRRSPRPAGRPRSARWSRQPRSRAQLGPAHVLPTAAAPNRPRYVEADRRPRHSAVQDVRHAVRRTGLSLRTVRPVGAGELGRTRGRRPTARRVLAGVVTLAAARVAEAHVTPCRGCGPSPPTYDGEVPTARARRPVRPQRVTTSLGRSGGAQPTRSPLGDLAVAAATCGPPARPRRQRAHRPRPGRGEEPELPGRRRRHLGGELTAAVEQPDVGAATGSPPRVTMPWMTDSLARSTPSSRQPAGLRAAHQAPSPSSIGTPTSEPHSVHEPS